MYQLADPLGACSVNIFRPGWSHAWHFDEARFTTTLCLQQPEHGGEFEYSPPLRDDAGDLAASDVAGIINAHSECGDFRQFRSGPKHICNLRAFRSSHVTLHARRVG